MHNIYNTFFEIKKTAMREHNNQQRSLPDLHDRNDLLFDPCELLLQTLSLLFAGSFHFPHLLLQLNLQLFSGLLSLLSDTEGPFKLLKSFGGKTKQ